VGHLFDENQATLETLSCETLIELQQRDQSLQSLFALCGQTDSSYQLQAGVLVRVYRDSLAPPDAAVHQSRFGPNCYIWHKIYLPRPTLA